MQFAAPRHRLTEITEGSIAELIHAFYREVRKDAVLGPVFADAIADAAWPAHLERMCRFWSAVMLSSGRYSGDPVAKHRAVRAIEQPMFDRWLKLFGQTASELFVPDLAAAFASKAGRIGASLQMAVFQRLPERANRQVQAIA